MKKRTILSCEVGYKMWITYIGHNDRVENMFNYKKRQVSLEQSYFPFLSESKKNRREHTCNAGLSLVRCGYPLITYYWIVPLILDHSYLIGKLTSSKIADSKVSGF
jgi:hypothetical protein